MLPPGAVDRWRIVAGRYRHPAVKCAVFLGLRTLPGSTDGNVLVPPRGLPTSSADPIGDQTVAARAKVGPSGTKGEAGG